MNIYKAICVILIFVFLVVMLISNNKESPLPVISDRERWDDLNDENIRNRFCQAMGYDIGRISEMASLGSEIITDYAGNPYGYNIACFKTIQEKQNFNYEQMKRWMLNIEINGDKK